jgi:hypothetical protein
MDFRRFVNAFTTDSSTKALAIYYPQRRSLSALHRDELAYQRERELCERERAAKANGNGSNAPEKFCYCRELVVNGRRVPCLPWHNCNYVARRSALVNEAAAKATEKCGDPVVIKNLGYRWTKIFNSEMTRLAKPLLNQSNNGRA